jgi:hypothetical protein
MIEGVEMVVARTLVASSIEIIVATRFIPFLADLANYPV